VAEQYIPGLQRIFYKSTGLKKGLDIEVTLFDSALNNNATIVLTEADDIKGLYYFDYIFYEGVYIARFREDGVESETQVYSIQKESSGGFRPFLGDNVINT